MIGDLEGTILNIQNLTQECYDAWLNTMYSAYENMEEESCGTYLDYIDDLQLNFKLFVDNTNPSANPPSGPGNIGTDLTYLPYTQHLNPIWEWDPCQPCSGIMIDGSEVEIEQVETAIYEKLVDNGSIPCSTTSGNTEPTNSVLTFTMGLNTIIWPGAPLTDFSTLPTELTKIIDNSNGDVLKYKGPTLGWVGEITELVPGNTYSFFSFGDFTWTPIGANPPPSTGTFPESLFDPCWKTFNFSLPECVCNDLRTLYPNKQFYMSLGIENYECEVCIIVDNIRIDVSDCDIQKTLSLNNCYVPQLSCVIDNKKSWVYNTEGVVEEVISPFGLCNTDTTESYTVTKMVTPEHRLWQELEYRYTEYDMNHSDLIINTKSATFGIDPAKAIECDVYNFWKQINCEECPTSCSSGDSVVFSGSVTSTGGTLSGYSITLSGGTSGSLTFSCETYTNILNNQVIELKNDYYSLTADYNESLDATYQDLLSKGETLSLFDIKENNCGSDNIIIGNNEELDNLFGIITEEYDGTISFWESYLYSGTTPHTGGNQIEVLSGITAQTFNQTTGFTSECCESINTILTSGGVNGLGVEKNYVWNTTLSACTWTTIDNCEGDCEYSGEISKSSAAATMSMTFNSMTGGNQRLELEATDGTTERFITISMAAPDTTGDRAGTGEIIVQTNTTANIFATNFCNALLGTVGTGTSAIRNKMTCTPNGATVTITQKEGGPDGNTAVVDVLAWSPLIVTNLPASFSGGSDTWTPGAVCVLTQVPTCINPLDYLDVQPEDIDVKQLFDEVVLSNLIDAKSRQTISNYPLLGLFYNLYLDANNCGKDISGKLTYNDLFTFMDKIGDYWLDLLEQVVPATTIWEGCDYSGKIYRNTIFEQNKYPYKKYSLKYVEVTPTCPLSAYTSSSIGSETVDIEVETIDMFPTNNDILLLQEEIKELKKLIYLNEQKLEKLKIHLCALQLQDPDELNDDDITGAEIGINTLIAALNMDKATLTIKEIELVELQNEEINKKTDYINAIDSCNGYPSRILKAENDLMDDFIVGSISYDRQVNFIAGLKTAYKKCIRKANTRITTYNTIFVTSIYNSNEYEGSVTVLGDPEWDAGDAATGEVTGPFFETELIHGCNSG